MYIVKEAQELYSELNEKISMYLEKYDEKTLFKAFKYAYNKHWKQKTICGRAYIVHLLGTAIRLAELRTDLPSIITAILHDVVIDAWVDIHEVKQKFWKEVSKLVEWITAITQIPYEEWMTTRELPYLKRLFKEWWKDLRVLLIKISDRIDFIQSIDCLEPEKKKLKARETLDIYVPMIRLFWIWKYIGNIEDLCYRYLEPEEFMRLDSILQKKEASLTSKITDYTEKIWHTLTNKEVENTIEWRIKTIYSISKKIQKKHIPFSWIYDLVALRVVVNKKRDCYIVLSVLHSLFKSKENRIKDYISAPKPNGYQSLHTTVSDSEWFHFEVQIQTKQMYSYNIFGLASHDSYKWFSTTHSSFPKWMKTLLKQQKSTLFWKDIIEHINPNVLKDTIICTTPKWKEIELPKKSSILDFAFKVHSDFWRRVTGAWVNNEYIEDLVYMLHDWDQITLTLQEEDSDYPIKYLSYIKTEWALKHLRKMFKTKSKKTRSLLWRHILNERMELLWYKPFSSMPNIIKKKVESDFDVANVNELYLEIGWWNIDVDRIINSVYHEKNDTEKYKSVVSLKVAFKKKSHQNINSLFHVFHELDIEIIAVHYKWITTNIDLHVKNLELLHELLAEILRTPNVSSVRRRLTGKIWFFIFILILVSGFIVLSPFVLLLISKYFSLSPLVYQIMFYSTTGVFVFLLYFFKSIVRVTLPWLIKQNIFWVWMFILNTFILATVIWWAISQLWNDNPVFFFSLTLLLYWVTLFEYLDSKWLDKK